MSLRHSLQILVNEAFALDRRPGTQLELSWSLGEGLQQQDTTGELQQRHGCFVHGSDLSVAFVASLRTACT